MNIKVKMYTACVKYWTERKPVCTCYDWYRGDYNCSNVGTGWYIMRERSIYICRRLSGITPLIYCSQWLTPIDSCRPCVSIAHSHSPHCQRWEPQLTHPPKKIVHINDRWYLYLKVLTLVVTLLFDDNLLDQN